MRDAGKRGQRALWYWEHWDMAPPAGEALAAPAQGASSQNQRGLKPGNKALDKARTWEENGGDTAKRWMVLNCTEYQNNYMCLYIYIFIYM